MSLNSKKKKFENKTIKKFYSKWEYKTFVCKLKKMFAISKVFYILNHIIVLMFGCILRHKFNSRHSHPVQTRGSHGTPEGHIQARRHQGVQWHSDEAEGSWQGGCDDEGAAQMVMSGRAGSDCRTCAGSREQHFHVSKKSLSLSWTYALFLQD